MRKIPLVSGNYYHIFNRGVNKRKIFLDKSDHRRFIDVASHYKTSKSKFSYRNNDTGSLGSLGSLGGTPKVEILAYCLMPNHFHFLIKQVDDNGITDFMRHVLNSYSHYFNLKHKREGPLFSGRFKGLLVDTTEQLLHLSRYIHLNPLVSGLTQDLDNYYWSSYKNYVDGSGKDLCDTREISSAFKSGADYRRFVLDQADYGRQLEQLKHLTVDHE